jgi:DNA-binding CsgD family transcriptional regulator
MMWVSVASPERLRSAIVDLGHRSTDVREFSIGAAHLLRRSVPFDGVCVVTLDPATLLPTGDATENAIPVPLLPRVAQIEIGGEDHNSFNGLLRSGRGTATLREATGGEFGRSLRHRELRAPNGFGDELRSVLAGETGTWGGLTLHRSAGREPFTTGETALVASLSRDLAEGLRRTILLAALSARPDGDPEAAGLLVLTVDGAIAMSDAAAEHWLAELEPDGPGGGPPHVIAAVARRAHVAGDALHARARVRTPAGTWLMVRASVLSGGGRRTAVTLEPARAHELAPLIADAYALTERERAVTQLVAQGLPTAAIATSLHISPWTVQDHLKAIFDKVNVGSRGELVARVFFEHYAPRLAEQAPLDHTGWYAALTPTRTA